MIPYLKAVLSLCSSLLGSLAFASLILHGEQRVVYVHRPATEAQWREAVSTIENAGPGTTLKLEGGLWIMRSPIEPKRSGTVSEPIVLSGADPKNPPVFDGHYLSNVSGCIHATASNYVIKDIEVTGCTSGNAIALGKNPVPSNITIERCNIHHNSNNGINGATNNLVISDCNIHHNGSGMTHNVYIIGGTVLVTNNWFHDSGGQNFHNRATSAVVQYNRMDSPASYSLDIMSCQLECGATGDNPVTNRMVLVGNVISNQGAGNHSQIISLWRDESNPWSGGETNRFELVMANNTFLGSGRESVVHSTRPNSGISNYSVYIESKNNLFVNVGGKFNIDSGSNTSVVEGVNQLGGVTLDQNFRPLQPVMHSGPVSQNLTAVQEYVHNPTGNGSPLYRMRSTINDVGAIEISNNNPACEVGTVCPGGQPTATPTPTTTPTLTPTPTVPSTPTPTPTPRVSRPATPTPTPTVTPTPGNTAECHDSWCKSHCNLEGAVNINGFPVSGAYVYADSADGTKRARTARDGSYLLKRLPEGTYRLRATYRSSGAVIRIGEEKSARLCPAPEVDFSLDQGARVIELHLSKPVVKVHRWRTAYVKGTLIFSGLEAPSDLDVEVTSEPSMVTLSKIYTSSRLTDRVRVRLAFDGRGFMRGDRRTVQVKATYNGADVVLPVTVLGR